MPHGSDWVNYECLRCETVQAEPKSAKNRGKTIHCRGCGGMVYPVEAEPVKVKVARVCRICGGKLRATNHASRCSSCER